MLNFFLLAVLTMAKANNHSEWTAFKQKYNKVYSESEDIQRRAIYEKSIEYIKAHNELYAQGKSTFTMKENFFADWTDEEWNIMSRSTKITYKGNPKYREEEEDDGDARNVSLPKNVDWRERGYVTPVKNQYRCGSCYAFSVTGALEGQHFAKTGNLVSLSESNIVDCSRPWGNNGCVSGSVILSYEYIIGNGGINDERTYPYLPLESMCAFNPGKVAARMRSYRVVSEGSEDKLKKAVAKVGPINVHLDTTNLSFRYYGGGVYYEPRCTTTDLVHSALAVGYGSTEFGIKYWLVKNSYGKDWGIGGYIKMSRLRNNMCGIASYATHPVV